MTQEQLINTVSDGNFNIQVDGKDESKLVTSKHMPGISLYPKVYNGTTTYIGVFGNELQRWGLSALFRIDDEWYVIPVVGDLATIKQLIPKVYSKALVLTGFAETELEADKLVTITKSLSTPFGFTGDVVKSPNKPTKRFPSSWSVKMAKNKPFKADLDSCLTQLDDFNWDD